jgi:hypothetical protein
MEYEIYTTDELAHTGRKGMKWGVRLYQNKDGSLTPLGRLRYQKKQAAAVKKRKATIAAKKKAAEKAEKAEKKAAGKNADDKKKSISEMTDEELDRAITRARKEDEYRRLRPEPVAKPKMMSRLVDEVLVPSAINSGKKLTSDLMDKAVNALLGNKVDPNSVEALKKVYDKLDYQNKIDKLRNPDKYLSEEDRKKRQEREFAAEDRAARMKGYKDAADEAEKKRAEDAASGRDRVHDQQRRNAWDRLRSKRNNPEDGERRRSRVDDEIDWDNWDGRTSSSRVYEGTVEGVGSNSRTRKQAESWTRKSDIIDMETYELTTTDNTNSGRSYVSNYLALPAPRDDD